jgi:hypothetical protein
MSAKRLKGDVEMSLLLVGKSNSGVLEQRF